MLIYSMICCIAKQAIDKAESCIHSINQHEVVVYSATIFNHLTHYVIEYRLLLADCNNTQQILAPVQYFFCDFSLVDKLFMAFIIFFY